MLWGGGGGGGGDNMIKCLGGEGQHAFGEGCRGRDIDMLWGRRAFGYQHPFGVGEAYFSSASVQTFRY